MSGEQTGPVDYAIQNLIPVNNKCLTNTVHSAKLIGRDARMLVGRSISFRMHNFIFNILVFCTS